jgi:hypothetical protein
MKFFSLRFVLLATLFGAPAAFLGPPGNDSLRSIQVQTEVQRLSVATVQSNAIQQVPSSFLFASAFIATDGRIQKIGLKTGDLYQRLAVETHPFHEPKKPPKFVATSLPTATVRVSKSVDIHLQVSDTFRGLHFLY